VAAKAVHQCAKPAGGGRWRLVAGLGAFLTVAATAAAAQAPVTTDEPGSFPAAFTARSYASGTVASLALWAHAPRVTIRFYRVGPERRRAPRDDVLLGVPAGPATTVSWKHLLSVRVPTGPSGLYFARLTTAGGRVGYAPFVLRPRRLGSARVLVVEPTNTWQAYNFRDGDTWYADPHYNGVDLRRPFLRHGVPPHFRHYDLGFLRWFARAGQAADFVADDDLQNLSGQELARRYDLVVFPGHEEYVTTHVWDAIARYRNLGGNLAFLSANDFFYRVERRGTRLYRTGRWRDVGRSDAALIGAGYVGWFENTFKNGPYVVTGAKTAPWLFAGTGLRNGASFGSYGIEIDQRTRRSPPHTQILAGARNLFGPGRSAEMTYYETPAGAKVFSAGAINFGGSAEWPVVSRLLDNLWRRLSRP
jgi:N,N-dimethylformamidase beta subunit-like, C-terminal